MLPPQLLNFVELFELQHRGEPVTWPEGVTPEIAYHAIISFFYPESEDEQADGNLQNNSAPSVTVPSVPTPTQGMPQAQVLTPEFFTALSALLELQDAGEQVVFPDGFTSTTARNALLSYLPNSLR